MYAGQMRTSILWQSPMQGQDAAGQPIDGWTDIGPDWADFRVLSGLEAIKADAVTSVTKASCRVRYREDLTPDMRAMVAGEAWGIVSIQPDVNKRRFVDIVLERTS